MIIHLGLAASVNITFKGRQILMSTEIEVNNCFLYEFSFTNENFATFTFVVKDMFNLQSKTSKDFLTSFSNFY